MGLIKLSNYSSARTLTLLDVVRRHDLGLVAIDLRDTLVRPPRRLKVARALQRVGIDESLAMLADESVSAALRAEFAGLPDVVDWKLVEIYEAALTLARQGVTIDAPAFERAFRSLCDEYRECTVALVPDEVMLNACQLLAQESCMLAIITDGPQAREAELISRVFPTSASRLVVFTSGLAGANKFQPKYYEKLAQHSGIQPPRALVIGNRVDKDIRPAAAAGCRTCLIEACPPRNYSGYWAATAIAALSHDDSAT